MASANPALDPTLPATQQAYWGNTLAGPAVIIPAKYDSPTFIPEPNWEAPRGQWSEWDTATIAGMVVPGIVKVRVRKQHRVHQKSTAGAQGATPTLLGFDPGEIDFELVMWTENHQAQFELLISTIQDRMVLAMAQAAKASADAAAQQAAANAATPQSKPKTKSPLPTTDPRTLGAFDVSHPGLAIYRIYSLYFLEGSVPTPGSIHGTFEARLRFVEFSPIQKAAASTLKGSTHQADNNFAAFGPPPAKVAPDATPAVTAP